ncbi:ribosome biogenesis protein bop1-like [Dendronephthya gigantea]|uniref:ribosome biogenesis protein bop1-like n=1 Tax=Dendronephthya gigantea TaxID=151771 RepID=UPI001068D549|nr:ribosome biogenesis protein bop1-like [Dendronephthya gigantea]
MPKRSFDSEERIPSVKKNIDLLPETLSEKVTIETGNDSTDSEESEYEGLGSEEDTDESGELESFGNDSSNESDEGEPNQEGDLDGQSASTKSEDINNGDEDENEENEGRRRNGRNLAKTKENIKSSVDNESEDSDEEELRNTIGNIPVEWYNEYPHIGYDLQGEKILKPATGDELDEFLLKMDDPNYWRTVKDKQSMKEIVLTDEELGIIESIQNKHYPASADDPYQPYIDHFTSIKMDHPISSGPEPKSRFIPSKWEHKKIMKIVRAIRNGWIKPKKSETDKPRYYMIWDQDDSQKKLARYNMHIPAPKMKLPGHEESYNPPPEYLPTEDEVKLWEDTDPEDRPTNFLPKKYSSLRLVPGYNNFVQERFERCLDLYLCPRQRKMRLNVNPEDLIPKLPKPKDLQPFPTIQSLMYQGHEGIVRCLAVDPSGQWLASGGDDKTLRYWEIATGRCLKKLQFEHRVQSVAWNPSPSLSLVCLAVDDTILIANTFLGDKLICQATEQVIFSFEPPGESKEQLVLWTDVKINEQGHKDGIRLALKHKKAIQQVTWHGKGDYFSVVSPDGANQSVMIHQLSKRRSQQPFRKSKGLIQCVRFHPVKPILFVATQRYVRVYDLSKQELLKKLQSSAKWISSMAVHPKGDNLIIGSYDRRLCWFDIDLSSYPYKTLRHHKKAVRQVTYHQRYPLFASCSDDGTVIICHGMVYSDLMQNPLIVPVKLLRGHKATENLGILDCVFHPSQPWIFTCGADSTVRLYT